MTATAAAGSARIDQLIAAARQTYRRVAPDELVDIVRDGALLVDTRPEAQRARDGVLPGAVVIDRNVLEWRLDPTCPHRTHDRLELRPVVLVCNEGYSSTLAVVSLHAVGIAFATDLIGGFQALLDAGHLRSLEELSGRSAFEAHKASN